MSDLVERMGGRKFVLTIIVLLLGTAVEMLGKNGLSANFVALLLGSGAIFGVANAAITMKSAGAAASGEQVEQPAAQQNDGAAQAEEAALKLQVLAESHEQLRSELSTQAEALNTATQLIKAMMKINSSKQ